MSLEQPAVGRQRVCVAGGSPEPAVSPEQLVAALGGEDVERYRALLPVGYEAGVRAYRAAVAELTARDLAEHYRTGLTFFHERFVPHLKATLTNLSGGVWRFDDYVAYAAGSDVDFMTHLIDAVAVKERVCLYPGDWYGFLVGASQQQNIVWDATGRGALACLCVPSVRNGHLTEEMTAFLGQAEHLLLNLNLFPTLRTEERAELAGRLAPLLDKAVLSISFSRGFGLTASQLGVVLVHRDHPLRQRFHKQWEWFTYFYNALAARAFMLIDLDELARVDALRRQWVHEWQVQRGLPVVETGSYYVKSYRATEVPTSFLPLVRGDALRLCFQPPMQ